jgi:hypothetical protein
MMREDAHVHVLLDSIPSRMEEFQAAMKVARRGWTFSTVWEHNANWKLIAEIVAEEAAEHETVIAPAYEAGGHEHHNMVALIVNELRHPNVIRYLTYVRGQGRSDRGKLVHCTPELADLKLAALQCYQSQWENPATAPWFPGGEYGTYQEWVVR